LDVRNDAAIDGATVTERATTAASTMTVAALGVESLFFNNVSSSLSWPCRAAFLTIYVNKLSKVIA
jgi:hypothetical protein